MTTLTRGYMQIRVLLRPWRHAEALRGAECGAKNFGHVCIAAQLVGWHIHPVSSHGNGRAQRMTNSRGIALTPGSIGQPVVIKLAEISNLLVDYTQRELEDESRVILENETWVALVPFWAAWPFETMLLPKNHRSRFDELSGPELEDLGAALKELTTRYDNLFECSFPYSMGWHYAPDPDATKHWQMYAIFYPPLLRSATVRKFMVGYEMLAEKQRDITPEQAAESLRSQGKIHYKERDSA